MNLPIEACLPELKTVLGQGRNAVLLAEPGAGKTTRTPLALLQEPWMEGKNILLLEPRRLAARSAAAFMARQLGEALGETVGYRIRQESVTSKKTRITVVTEGILTRMLQSDPALLDTGLIIFDEFHERSLHADLGLALSRQSQELLREDLRLLVMSATLHADPVSELLGGAAVIRSEGRAFPVETRYLQAHSTLPMDELMGRTIQAALQEHEGNILAFLPGVKEIHRTEQFLRGAISAEVLIAPLYGSLSQEEQRKAIAAPGAGKRKVVLATSIAESSLTVEGVTVVIDAGLRRTQLFSPRTGMGRLVTVRAAKDSADQRRGRAGRTAPGICYRLWTEAEHRALPEATPPEIMEADLALLALELAAWGVKSPAELAWIDAPPEAAYRQAADLLQRLEAVDASGTLTPEGQEIARLGIHPRLGRMLLAARPHGCIRLASLLAALLEDPRVLRAADPDARSRLEQLRQAEAAQLPRQSELGAMLVQAREWAGRLSAAGESLPSAARAEELCGLLLSYAYPDRIGQRRPDGRYLLSNGRGAAFPRTGTSAAGPYIVAAELDDEGAEARITLAAPLEEALLEQEWHSRMTEEERVQWNPDTESVQAWQAQRLGAIVWKERPIAQPSPEAVQRALLQAAAESGLSLLPWTPKARQLQQRIQFLSHYSDGWPSVSDEALGIQIHEWLGPYTTGFKRKSDLQKLNLFTLLQNLLSWEQQRELETEAPSSFVVPSGSRITIHYGEGYEPHAAVRLQEVFGLLSTPRLAFGHVPLLLHLLSPAGRPVQVTADLGNFWKSTYFDVKKDLKGRYPKHYWPDDPMEATATRRVRPEK
ncbi:ATP-dependent helicase HrpB [Paenibacillus sp. CAA11]|uniref:ATP-dependent helicase HrpB n=1 Tax=Paenibacillus sp. CAA11 TaxID=1532905 RepID=UPI001F44FFA4|nr:ATP-dependent helicase HrpB [Paenibacillus sp. CAA11]